MGKPQKVNRFLMERSKGDLEDEPMNETALMDPMKNDMDVLVDDYKDLPIEMVASSRERKLWWMGVDE